MDKQCAQTPSGVNRVAAILLLLLLLTVALRASVPTPVLAQGPGEALLYEESFGYNDYSKVPGWALESEYGGEVGWAVENGQLRGRRHYWATYEEGNWFDTHLELTAFLHDGFEGLHISVRLSKVGRYFLALHPDRVVLSRQLGFGAGESVEDIGRHERNLAGGKPHGVSISVYEGRVVVVIDGVTEFRWDDPDPLPAGTIAVETLDKGWVEVDDVRVYGPAPAAGPDLSIVAADEWELSEGIQTLVLHVVVANKGDVAAPETAARAGDPETGWESALVPVAPLKAGADTRVTIELKIPEDQRGRDHVFLVQVDPGNVVSDESNRGNNDRWTPPIRIPSLPVLQEPYIQGIQPDRGRPGEEMTVRISGYNLTPECGVFIPNLVEVRYVRFVDSGEMEARIAIDPEAPPGPRPVSVGVEGGPVAVLEDGFTVEVPIRPIGDVPPPDRDGGGLDPLVPVLIVVGGLVAGAAVLLLGRGRGGRRGGEEQRRVALGAPESYYYSSGTRVPLRRRDDLIAVKYRGIDSHTAAARTGMGADVPGFRPPAAEDLWPGGEVVLRQEPGGRRSPEQQQALLRALNQRADVEHASFVYELNPDDSWIATDLFVAQFGAGMSQAEIAALNGQYGVEVVETIAWLPRAYLLRVTPASPGDALSMANTYVEKKHAAWAHPNFLRKYAHRMPVLRPEGAAAERHWQLSAIKAFEAWQISSGSPDVVVAIIDDGADIDHTAFPNQAVHLNAINRSGDPRPPAEQPEMHAHGTACAGLAVGTVNQAIGTSGVAPGCRLMAVLLLDRVIPVTVEQKLTKELMAAEWKALLGALSVVSPYREATALQWASEHGADVISNSWGPPDGYAKFGKAFPIDDIARLALTWAIEHGRDGKGCVICWAAGNGDESISFDGYASRPEVLAVGACTVDGKRAPYSDYGPEVGIAAPGGGYTEGRLTTVDVDLRAHQAYRHDFNGTSAAAPIVAGVAALVLSVNPDLTREEVYDILRDTADRIDSQGGQYDGGGHSPFYGRGRVNARRALERAAQHESCARPWKRL